MRRAITPRLFPKLRSAESINQRQSGAVNEAGMKYLASTNVVNGLPQQHHFAGADITRESTPGGAALHILSVSGAPFGIPVVPDV